MYGKLTDGKLVTSEVIETANIIISNPSDEQFINNGFKKIVYSEKPNLTDTQKLSESFAESDTQITVNYTAIDKTSDEIKAETTAKIVELESSYMLPRYLRQLILADTTIADTTDIKIKANEIEKLAESLRN